MAPHRPFKITLAELAEQTGQSYGSVAVHSHKGIVDRQDFDSVFRYTFERRYGKKAPRWGRKKSKKNRYLPGVLTK